MRLFQLLILTFIFPFASVQIAAQQVYVYDGQSQNPIGNVAIVNEDRSVFVLTDSTGTANLYDFQEDAILSFTHPSYIEFTSRKSSLEASGYQVPLTEKIVEIDEVIISASRWAENRAEVPARITQIGPEMARFNNPQTTADLLASSGEVFVQKSQLGGGSPMIRGFAANSILIIVDGIRMNNAIYRSGNLQNVINIDANLLRSAEVIYGPGSVTYGSDALGGVMNFITKDPKFSDTNEIEFSGSAMVRYSSASNENTWHFDAGLGGKKLAWLGSFTSSRFDNLRSGSVRPDDFPDYGKRSWYVERIAGMDSIVPNENENLQLFSGYDQFNTLQKLRYRINDRAEATYTFQYSETSDIPRYDRLIETDGDGLPVSSQWYYGPQKWQLHSLSINAFRESGFFDASRIILGYQHYEESRHNRRFRSDTLNHRTEKVDIFTANLDFDKSLYPGHHIYYGAEWYHNNVASSAFGENIENGSTYPVSTRYPNDGSRYFGYGAYLNYRYKVVPELIFNGGFRYSYTGLTGRNRTSGVIGTPFEELDLRNSGLSGSIGGVFLTSTGWKLSAMITTGFRAPNLDDVGKIFEVASGVVTVPNDELEPENTINYELGISKLLTSKLAFEWIGFYSVLRNAMVRRDFPYQGQDSIIYDDVKGKTVALVNTGKANIYGTSFNLRYEPVDGLQFRGAITYTAGEDQADNVPLRHTPPVFGMLSARYVHDKLRLELFSQFQGSRSFDELAPSEQDKPHLYAPDGALSWWTLNLRGSFELNEYLTLDGGVENILDRYYRTYSSGISGPGRNFYITIRGFIPEY